MTKVYQTRGAVPPWTMAGTQLVLRDHHGDDGNGGGDSEFQTKVLDGVKALADASLAEKKRGDTLQESIAKMLGDVTRLDKTTQDTLKDIETHKKVANDNAANFLAMQKRFKLLDARIKMEARAAFGSPMQRLLADEGRRTRLNAAFRVAVEFGRVAKSIAEGNSLRASSRYQRANATSGSAFGTPRLYACKSATVGSCPRAACSSPT